MRDFSTLKGKVAIVTGGAGHLGTAISEALAEAGANVVIASRNVGNCRALAKKLSQNYPKAIGLKLDTTDESSVFETVKEIISKFGRIDILFNNAYSAKARRDVLNSKYSVKYVPSCYCEEF